MFNGLSRRKTIYAFFGAITGATIICASVTTFTTHTTNATAQTLIRITITPYAIVREQKTCLKFNKIVLAKQS